MKITNTFVVLALIALNIFMKSAKAQRNYFQTNPIQATFLQKPIETANSVIYFYNKFDTLMNGIIMQHVYAQRIDKNSYQPLRLVTVYSERYFPEEVNGISYSYNYNSALNEIDFYFSATDYDSLSSFWLMKFAKTIHYTKIDENLNV